MTNKIKQFFPSRSCVDTAIWMHHMDANKTYEEKAWRQLHKNATSHTEQVLEAAPYKTAAVQPSNIHHESYPS